MRSSDLSESGQVNPTANPDSDIEKGSKSELPKDGEQSEGSRGEPVASGGPAANKEGVVVHSDDPKTRAESPVAAEDKTDEGSAGSRTTITSTSKPTKKASATAADADADEDEPKKGQDDSNQGAHQQEESTSEADDGSRSDLADDKADSELTTANLRKIFDGDHSASANDKQGQSRASNIASTNKTGGKQAAGKAKPANAGADVVVVTTTKSPMESMKKLAKQSKQLVSKKNTTIVVNGRRFDQVNPIECVDEKFYNILMSDLALIDPARRLDYYGTYYDYEYAKAMGAIIDTPAQTTDGAQEAHNADAAGGSPSAGNQLDDFKAPGDILAEVKKLWRETFTTYTTTKERLAANATTRPTQASQAASLDGQTLNNSTIKPMQASANVKTNLKHKSALANYRYLLSQLEILKGLLLNGEESLIMMNNRVKKLNQMVAEDELQTALCNCITSRGGRAALMLMNDLFTDKNSADAMKDLDLAKRKAEAAARDTAEFCSYWYGDTIRSEAVQKEKAIKKLVLQLAKHKHTVNKTAVIKTTKTIKRGKSTLRETQTRVVTTIVQMTSLWLPKLSDWIKTTLNVNGTATNNNGSDNLVASLMKNAKPLNETTTTVTEVTSAPVTTVEESNHEEDSGEEQETPPKPTNSGKAKTKVRKERAAEDENSFSTPFDHSSTYADVDDPEDLESSSILQSFIGSNYFRQRRAAPSNPTPAPAPAPKLAHKPMRPKSDMKRPGATTTTTKKPLSASKAAETGNATAETDFETRTSARTAKCAADGFTALLELAYDQNALMYETNRISKNDSFIQTMHQSYVNSFARFWKEQRNEWARKLASNSSSSNSSSSTGKPSSKKKKAKSKPMPSGRSVDEEIADSFESTLGSYDRGAQLGYTVGKFIGEKAAYQWPDPAELNTFTYDSLFLAGVGQGYSEEESRKLERRIVAETAKRVAFTEANRQAFAKTIHSAYLNGATIVPLWGVLHAQRAVAKKAATEGSKAGFEAASKAAGEFSPKAIKFFRLHEHQRALAAPYKQRKHLSDKWAGLSEQISVVQMESELNKNISKSAIDCGQKSGTLMGALLGLIVAPEAFETYTRFRGSLEAIESEFNQFKLGAMRGYELGETWAYLNYTAQMNQNLNSMKTQMKKTEAVAAANSSSGNSTTAAPSKRKRRRTTTTATKNQAGQKKLEKETSVSLFDEPGEQTKQGPSAPNTNNLFQFMVPNYGTYLVANHSRKHMLKLRTSSLDELVLRDLKVQAGDLLADPGKFAASTDELNADAENDLSMGNLEKGHFVGELLGEFNTVDNKKKKPIKLNIIDLGPVLEMKDEIGGGAERQVGKSMKSEKDVKNSRSESTPLTESLSKMAKFFIKLDVHRSKPKVNGDDVSRYLNGGNQLNDHGDGYLCGTFSQLGSKLANGTTVQAADPNHPAVVQDDFSLEVAILDELFERIERASADMGTVELVENVMTMTTIAPGKTQRFTDTKPPAAAAIRPGSKSSSSSSSAAPKTTTTTTTTAAPSSTADAKLAKGSRSSTLVEEEFDNNDDDIDAPEGIPQD